MDVVFGLATRDLGARRRPADRERPAGGDPLARPSCRRRTSARATGWRSCSPDDARCSRSAASAPATTRGDVLQGVDLDLHQGEVVALLGRNGVGKTTLMNTIVGLVRPRAGSIELDGRELAGASPHEIARAGIAIVPQGRRIFARLTVEENLKLARRAAGGRPVEWTLERRLRAASRGCGSGGGTAATSSRAASSRWSRSAVRCSRTRASFSSTSRPRGSRRSSST